MPFESRATPSIVFGVCAQAVSVARSKNSVERQSSFFMVTFLRLIDNSGLSCKAMQKTNFVLLW